MKYLLKISRLDVFKITRFGFAYNRKCRSCWEYDSEETVKHIFCNCRGFTAMRHRAMEKFEFEVLFEPGEFRILPTVQNGLTTIRNSSNALIFANGVLGSIRASATNQPSY